MPVDSKSLRTFTTTKHSDLFFPIEPSAREAAAQRYQVTPEMVPYSNDALAVARSIFPVATALLKKDGYHMPALFLHHPDQGWHMREVLFEDKLDKFLVWRRIAEDVEDEGYDGAIFVNESWAIRADAIVEPFESFEHVEGRTEHLTVAASSADGRRLNIDAEFHRKRGRIVTVDEPNETVPSGAWFLSPVDRAWSRMSSSTKGATADPPSPKG